MLEEILEYPVMLYVTRVVFDNSFKAVKPKSMYGWFAYCRHMTSLDIRGLDTSEVTNMDSTLYSCSSLTSLDLSKFVTSKVKTMDNLF